MLYRSSEPFVITLASILMLVFVAMSSPCVAVRPYPDPFTLTLEELAPAPSNQALRAIPDLGRKLLARKIYLRTGSRLTQRWSWTDEEIEAFKVSPEYKAL